MVLLIIKINLFYEQHTTFIPQVNKILWLSVESKYYREILNVLNRFVIEAFQQNMFYTFQ